MTIERRVSLFGVTFKRESVMPGIAEELTPKPNLDNYLENPEYKQIYVNSSESVIVYMGSWVYNNDIDTSISTVTHKVSLNHEQVNEYKPQSKTWYGKKIIYGWKPTKKEIDPIQEAALQDLLSKGQITNNQAHAMRHNLLSERKKSK